MSNPLNDPVEPLSERELEILSLLAEGLTNREIAGRLFLSYETIKWYNKQIYAKLDVNNRTEAASHAYKFGLLDNKSEARSSEIAAPNDNLPAQLTSFIGREQEITEITSYIRRQVSRLVTLSGPGGIGKTRLALEIAQELRDDFSEGVFFVEFSPTHNHDHVAETIANTLKIRITTGQNPSNVLASYLANRQMLLVIDNFEHLVENAEVLVDLLSAAPDLTILITSRESLQVYGEMNYPVPPLSLPEVAKTSPLKEVLKSEAVELFAQRALATSSRFKVSEENFSIIANICTKLEGLPLAIELAAASLKHIDPESLLEKLNQSVTNIKPGPRGLPERQRTLHATIAWSYELLTESEKLLFAPLSVFRNGFSVKAAQSLMDENPAGDVEAVLEALASKSLLVRQTMPGSTPRYMMLEAIREFAHQLLEENKLIKEYRNRHAAIYAHFAEEAVPALVGSEQVVWLRRLEQDYGNIQAALAWTLSGHKRELGLHLVATLRDYWYYQGRSTDGLHWVEAALENVESVTASVRADLFNCAAHVLMHHDKSTRAQELLHESLAIYRELKDLRNTAWSLASLSFTWVGKENHYEQALASCDQALSIFRDLDDARGMMATLTIKGRLMWAQGDFDRAEQAYIETLEIARQSGNQIRESSQYANLGLLEYSRGEYSEADWYFRQCIELSWEIGLRHMTALGLAALAGPLNNRGETTRAATLIGASEAFRSLSGTAPEALDQSILDGISEVIRGKLGETAYKSAYSKGRAMALHDAVAVALGDLSASPLDTTVSYHASKDIIDDSETHT